MTIDEYKDLILEEFASGARVIQRDFEWFLSEFGTLKPFVDGMKI